MMGYRFQYLEKGVVYINWFDRVTVDELEVGVKEINQVIDKADDQIYVEIIDLLECTAIPFDLRGLRRVATHDHRIVGYIIVNPNAFAKTMANMLIQVTQLPFRFVSTPEVALATARDILSQHTPTSA
ncbi:MAG: hypothetical protein R3E39_29870 [Anaerolineae bacterium]